MIFYPILKYSWIFIFFYLIEFYLYSTGHCVLFSRFIRNPSKPSEKAEANHEEEKDELQKQTISAHAVCTLKGETNT